jgi:hypothetical protein
MKHNLIKTDNYLLVVDDSEIKEGDWYKTPLGIYSQFNGTEKLLIGTRRVASHAPLNGAPYLDGVDSLPPMGNDEEDDIEVLANKMTNHLTFPEERREGIVCGYNKAYEKYKFTEEDILDAWELGAKEGAPLTRKKKEDLFDFLHQPKLPIVFECITDFDCCRKYVNCWGCDAPPDIINLRPKTIINSEGRTEWVGKWIFEQPKPNI